MKKVTTFVYIISWNFLLLGKQIPKQNPMYHEHATQSEMTMLHTQNNPWRSIQNITRNTVVQVFAQIAEFDWLQPFRTPAQFAARGSGFFINDQGYIITNAHVIDQAVAIWIQMPESLGKYPLKAHIIGACPDRDLALLKIDAHDLTYIKKQLGSVPFLYLGDSDTICRADRVLGLGYPLGQESLKGANGIISGREHIYQNNQYYIQTDTPINAGNSGGPLINVLGEVIGINTAAIPDAQNIGYAIPINELKLVINELLKNPIVHKPFAGLITVKETDHYTKFLNNPEPGGCFVLEVINDSLFDKIGIQHGDMIYKINGLPVDIYGEVCVDWNNEVRISISDYISGLALDTQVTLELYRTGEKIMLEFTMAYINPFSIRRYYPWYETVEYEVIAGMVVMPLTMNHIQLLSEHVPGLLDYAALNDRTKPALVVTHIFPNSELARGRSVAVGYTITRINGTEVHTLDDLRTSVQESIDSNTLHMEFADQISSLSDRIPVVLPLDFVTREVVELSSLYRYPIFDWIKDLHKKIN